MARKASGLGNDTAPLEEQKENRVKRRKARKIREDVSFKDTFSYLLSLQVPKETLQEAIKASPLGEKINYREAILLAQIIKATNGDTQAAVFVRDTSGNKLKDGEGVDKKRKNFEDF